jgi:hypothetical protein
MSRSEKMRYYRHTQPIFPLEDYTAKLEKAFENQTEGFLTHLGDLIRRERSVSYQIVARFVPMQREEMVNLLQAKISEEKNGESIISEDGEDAVQKITIAFHEKAGELIKTGAFLEAAEIAFVIVIVVEPELCNVYDEGWTYQMIVADAFQLLEKIGGSPLNPDISETLSQKTTQIYNSRPEQGRYCDSLWEKSISLFKKTDTQAL